MGEAGRLAAGMVVSVLLAAGSLARPAPAEDPVGAASSPVSRYQVTFVARSCPGYQQVMANRARDDLIEAGTAPGRDSEYSDGQVVDPDVEARAGTGCEPLTGWRFTFGSGHERQGALSVVTGVGGEAGPTLAETARLGPTGWPTDVSVGGAVTVRLSDEQVRLAMRRQLWVQGGTPGDPLLGKAGGGLAFGVLRCAIDGRSGGNVQWIGFPAGVRHVFCYAYYVRGAPPAATVVVRAKTQRPVGYPQRVGFTATFGYSPDRTFDLVVGEGGAETRFVRSAGGPSAGWRVAAQVPAGWRVAELTCRATRPGGGAAGSSATVDAGAGRADIVATGGETVTCSYTFEPPKDPSGLTVRVYSEGGPGEFGVAVAGAGGTRALSAEAGGDGSASLASGVDTSRLPPGTYTLTVTPPGGAGEWRLAGANCGGVEIRPSGWTVPVPLTAGVGLGCVLRVARAPAGLKLRLVTTGAAGTAAFVVVPAGSAGTGWSAVASTRAAGTSADASGDLPAVPPADTYLVTPVAPRATAEGDWALAAFGCEPTGSAKVAATGAAAGGGVPGDNGALTVGLVAGGPSVVCTASYRSVPATRLQVVLRFEGITAARSGPAVVDVSCAEGSTGRVVLSADDYGQQSLPSPLSFLEATTCTLTQSATGVAGDADVTASAVLNPAAGNVPLALPATVVLRREVAEYTVTVTDDFDLTIERSDESDFLPPFRTWPMLVLGSGVVGVGALLLLVVVARWRRNPS